MSYHTDKEHSFVENDVEDATYDDPYDPTYHDHSYRDDHLSHQEEENPPPPPKTRPKWRNTEKNFLLGDATNVDRIKSEKCPLKR